MDEVPAVAGELVEAYGARCALRTPYWIPVISGLMPVTEVSPMVTTFVFVPPPPRYDSTSLHIISSISIRTLQRCLTHRWDNLVRPIREVMWSQLLTG